MTPVSFEKEAALLAAEAARVSMLKATPGVPGVYACIVKVSAELAKDGISKDRKNEQQGYKFRGIDDVLNALAPMLAKAGLVILPRCLSRNVVERQTAKGGTLFYVTVEAEFDFVCAADGSTHTVRMFGEAMDSADKATNKAMSAAYKYAAFQTFCIPTEGEDADATTHELNGVIPQGHATGHAASDQIQEPSVTKHVATPPGARTFQAPPPQVSAAPADRGERENTAEPPVGDRGSLPTALGVLITKVDETTMPSGKMAGKPKWYVHFEDGNKASTIRAELASKAQVLKAAGTRVKPELSQTKWGYDLLGLFIVSASGPAFQESVHTEPLDESEIPF